VSVLITAYNREPFVAEAIESAMRSTLRDIEIVVVDDRSTDRTAEIARNVAVADERVKVFVNDSNLGDYPNRNRAASHAKGTYIKYLDSDDWIYPHGLEVMVNCMEAFPEAGLGLSAVPDPAGPAPRFLSPREAYRENFFQRDLLARAPGSAIIKRAAFEVVGGFSGKRQVGDHELWLKMARRFGVVKMPTDLVWDRQHADQQKHFDSAVEKAVMHEEVEVAALHADDCPLSPEERRSALARLEQTRGRRYWHFVRSEGGFSVAEAYRRRAAVSIPSLFGAALRFSTGR
jgi:glycosyltransferase involved in cell wall biosynthesis